jgi:hypothetical protein
MKLPDEPSIDSSARANRPAQSDGAVGAGAGPRWIQALSDCLMEIYGSGHALLEVYADRVRISLRRTIVQVAIGAVLTVGTAIGLSAAVLVFLRGACGGFTALWGGNAWLGDLTAGSVAVMLAASAVALSIRSHTRRELRRLEAKYARIRNESDESRVHPRPPGDDPGVPGSGGSPGDREHIGLRATAR